MRDIEKRDRILYYIQNLIYFFKNTKKRDFEKCKVLSTDNVNLMLT